MTSSGLSFDDLGRGEPALLLLTGWCSSRARWARAASLLAADRRVVSFDWRGHGESAPAREDFGAAELVEDALTVVAAAGLQSFVVCSASHSGWVAIELRRQLGDRVRAIVHLDWMVTEPPPPFKELISELQSEQRWSHARDILLRTWQAGDERPEISEAISVMAQQDAAMWMRSGREIEAAYRVHGSPLRALSELRSPPRVLHLYGQPASDEYLAAQEQFAAEHTWFTVRRNAVRTHFSMLEEPEQTASAIRTVASLPRRVGPTAAPPV